MLHRSFILKIAGTIVIVVPLFVVGGNKSFTVPAHNGSAEINYCPQYTQQNAPDSLNMRLSGYYGLQEYTTTMALQGSYLYADAMYGFVVFDVGTEPENPRMVTSVTNGPWWIYDLVAYGNFLYVMQSDAGIFTYDISNPKEPQQVDRVILAEPYPVAKKAVIVNRALCVVAADESLENPQLALKIFSVDNPAHPLLITTLGLPSIDFFVVLQAVDSNTILVAGSPANLYLVDISDLQHPLVTGECDLWSIVGINPPYDEMRLRSLFCDNRDVLYSTIKFYDLDSNLTASYRYIFDISDFSNPVVLDSLNEHREEWFGLLGEDTLMVMSSDTLYFYDISAPGSLLPVASWSKETEPGEKPLRFMDRIIPSGELLYSCGFFWGLHLFNRHELGNIQDLWSTYCGTGSPQSISSPAQDRFFVSFWGDRDYNLYRFTTSVTGQIRPTDSLISDCFGDLFCKGDFLGAVGGDKVGQQIFFYNVAQPDTFILLGQIGMSPPSSIRLSCNGARLFISSGDRWIEWGGMTVVDISEPTAPELVAFCNLRGVCKDIREKNNLIYVTGQDGTTNKGYLEIYRLNRSELEALSSVVLEEIGLGLCLVDKTLYVSRYNGLDIFDVSDSTAPELLGTATELLGGDDEVINRGGRNDDVLVVGDRAFVASDEELVAFDISDPSSPKLVGYYIIPEHASWTPELRQRLRADKNFLYWSTQAYGLCLIDPYGDAEAVAENLPLQDFPQIWAQTGLSRLHTIYYFLPSAARVEISVFDVMGRKLRTLIEGYDQPGLHSLSWDGKDGRGWRVPQGVYFITLATGRTNLTTKIIKID